MIGRKKGANPPTVIVNIPHSCQDCRTMGWVPRQFSLWLLIIQGYEGSVANAIELLWMIKIQS